MVSTSFLGKGLAALALLVLPAVQAATPVSYPNPGACTGDCWTHDPAVVEGPDGSYYRFSTGRLIGIYKADALEGPWTKAGSVIQSKSIIDIPGNNDLWVSYNVGADLKLFLEDMLTFVNPRHLMSKS